MTTPQITTTVRTITGEPNRNDPDNFNDESDKFFADLPGAVADINAVAPEMNAVATSAAGSAAAAAASRDQAQAAAQSAAISANVTVWSAATTYPAGAIVTDPDDGYRLYTSQAGSNTNHPPSADDGTWWRPTGAGVLDWELGTTHTVAFNAPDAGDITETWVAGVTTVATRVTVFDTNGDGNDQITVTFARAGATVETVTVFEADGTITTTKTEA